jgi:hypothetical protein
VLTTYTPGVSTLCLQVREAAAQSLISLTGASEDTQLLLLNKRAIVRVGSKAADPRLLASLPSANAFALDSATGARSLPVVLY